MTCAEATHPASPSIDAYLWDSIGASAIETRDTGATTAVLVLRRQGILRWARYVARRVGTEATTELTAAGVASDSSPSEMHLPCTGPIRP
jgi:hypothetical protein